MKDLTFSIRTHFGPILEREGFHRVQGQAMSFVKRVENVKELHVDVHDLSYVIAFSVNLQDLSWDGKRARARSLERFAGLQHYSCGDGSAEEIEKVVRLAAKHLSTLGVRWLNGEDVETPSTLEGKKAAHRYRFQECIRKAREAFKNEKYEEALVLFSEASNIQSLDEVSEKFRTIATRRLKNL